MTAIPRFGVSNRFRKEEGEDLSSSSASSRNGRYYGSDRSVLSSRGHDDLGITRSDSLRAAGLSEDDAAKLGFANLPDQMHRKAVKKGFNFTLMVVGQSGLGKSTLINSLFMQEMYKDREVPSAHDRVNRTTQIEKRYIELDEKGVKLRVTVVDTPGYLEAVNSDECWAPIEEYIDNAFEQYFKDECGLNRKNIQDSRVHCCLYFISPYGHGLNQVDVEFMRRLHHKVNIVPIVAKADTLTSSEIRDLKDKVLEDLERHKIDTYHLPDCDSDEDDEFKQQDSDIKGSIPFSVIGSNCTLDVDGRRVRGRQYPWGVVEVENPKHCDFLKLRMILLGTHMQDLIDMTRDVHYENYRAKYITERMSKRQTERNQKRAGIIRVKRDSSPGFEAIVDPDQLLKQKEEEILRMQQMLSRMQEQLKTTTNAEGGTSPAAQTGQ